MYPHNLVRTRFVRLYSYVYIWDIYVIYMPLIFESFFIDLAFSYNEAGFDSLINCQCREPLLPLGRVFVLSERRLNVLREIRYFFHAS